MADHDLDLEERLDAPVTGEEEPVEGKKGKDPHLERKIRERAARRRKAREAGKADGKVTAADVAPETSKGGEAKTGSPGQSPESGKTPDPEKDGKTEKTTETGKAPEGEKAKDVPPPPPAPIGTDELSLTQDPQYSKAELLGWFGTQVKNTVEAWGLAFDAKGVRLASAGKDGGLAVALKWDSAWGSPPVTRHVPFNMSPIDAQASLTAAHALKGWGKLDGGTQGILDNLFGGETNLLSQSARGHLRPQYAGLKAKTEDEQASALKGAITAKEAKPQLASEDVVSAAVKFTLAGPTEEKNYDFRGKKADAEKWVVSFADGVSLTIMSPKAPEPGYHNHSVQQTADAASYLPKSAREVINTVVLNVVVNPDDAYWATKYNRPNFHSYMTAGASGVVTIYPDPVGTPLQGEQIMRGSMIHETGHTWSKKQWGEENSFGNWVKGIFGKNKWDHWQAAMDKDQTSVSGYATAAIAEDVAETVRVYASVKGTPKHDEYRKIVPNRFAILDKEYAK